MFDSFIISWPAKSNAGGAFPFYKQEKVTPYAERNSWIHFVDLAELVAVLLMALDLYGKKKNKRVDEDQEK